VSLDLVRRSPFSTERSSPVTPPKGNTLPVAARALVELLTVEEVPAPVRLLEVSMVRVSAL